MTDREEIGAILLSVQKDLLVLGAELSALPDVYGKLTRTITDEDIARLEKWIDELQEDVPLKNEFIYPGGTVVSSQIDVGRTVVRRAERWAARMKSEGMIPNERINRYLNRLADMLFTLARYEEGKAGR